MKEGSPYTAYAKFCLELRSLYRHCVRRSMKRIRPTMCFWLMNILVRFRKESMENLTREKRTKETKRISRVRNGGKARIEVLARKSRK